MAVAAMMLFPGAIQAADNAPTSTDKDAIQSIEFFAARQAGMIDVNFIPRNSKQANILIRNNTNKPVVLNMPQAFGGIPVVGQFGGGMGGGGMGGGTSTFEHEVDYHGWFNGDRIWTEFGFVAETPDGDVNLIGEADGRRD